MATVERVEFDGNGKGWYFRVVGIDSTNDDSDMNSANTILLKQDSITMIQTIQSAYTSSIILRTWILVDN